MPETPLTLDALLMVRELPSGDWITFPLADAAAAAAGSEADVLEEERLYLEQRLSRGSAQLITRFAAPPGVELRFVEVEVPLEALPKKTPMQAPLELAVLVIPSERDHWVVVPRLGHTFFVPQKQPLEAAITAEIRRLAVALEPSPIEYLRLLPSSEERTTRLTLSLTERLPEGSPGELERAIAEKRQRHDAREILASVALPLHERPEAHSGAALVGRDQVLGELGLLLGGKARLSTVLVGPELTGKSALLHAWLRREHAAGRKPQVFATSGAELIAGMSGLGQWQERLRRVLTAAETLDAILYFENLGDLFNERPGGHIDLASVITPFLQEGRVRLVGELTPEGLGLLESAQVGFFSNLGRIRLAPLSRGETRQALELRMADDRAREPERPQLLPEAVDGLMELVDRYLPYRPYPGKALRFYEELRAVTEHELRPDGAPAPIDAERVLEAFSAETGIPVFLLREDRALHAEELLASFRRRVIGQESAIQSLVEIVSVVKAGLQPGGKPLASLLFVGPTGVGKTELARALAALLFGAEARLVRFDMSEYVDPWAAERLIRGSGSEEGLLTQRVRQQPFSILLLDEIEKAHPAVFDLLLQVIGEGRLSDARGRTTHFHNTVIIMTSNIGAAHQRAALGIEAEARTRELDYQRQVHLSFRPEFVNRLDRIIVFEELRPAQVAEVARVAVARLAERRGLAEHALRLALSEAALARLAADGYSPAYGARQLGRHLEQHLVAPISRLLARAGADAQRATLHVDVVDPALPRTLHRLEHQGLFFALVGGRDARQRREEWGTSEVSNLRRTADRYLALDRAQEVKAQLGFLVSQLASGGRQERPRAQELGQLQTEHHRLEQVWRRAQAAHQDLLSAEELSLAALFSGADGREALALGKRAFAELRRAMVYLLLAQEKGRDEVTLLIEDHDQRALSVWLAPLAREAPRRGWQLSLFVPPVPHLPAGPAPHTGGLLVVPELDVETLAARFAGALRQNLVLRVRGAYAGALLALEGGLHRAIKLDPERNPLHFRVSALSFAGELSPEQWKEICRRVEAAKPPTGDLTILPAVREYDAGHERLLVSGRKKPLPLAHADYWRLFEEVALEHLLGFEENSELDRDELFRAPLDLRAPGEDSAS